MKITVILTSYNHEKFLRESIESVLKQTYKDYEFIIVDDCSTDTSWDIICEYKNMYPQIITIRHEYNWHGGTVEDVVKNYATGEYIALHHSDDIWEADKLEKQIEAMKNNAGCVAVFSNAQAIDDEGKLYTDEGGFYYNLFETNNRTRQEWLNYFFYHGNCLCHPSILIRKDIYESDGFFRKGLRQIPDFVKWIQICKKHEIFIIKDPLVKFRVHSEGKNASGMRAETQIRSTVEWYLMLSEYSAINNCGEFLKIFPEAKDYCREDAYIPEFAFGKLCMQENMSSYVRLYGISLVYSVLNDGKKAELIKKVYHYTMQDFMQETGKQDIFGILPAFFEQTCSLYVDTGEGFNSKEVYSKKYTLSESEIIEWKCKIELNDGHRINALRFDPTENVMIKSSILKVELNGMRTESTAENAISSESDKQLFVNTDPIYSIIIPDELKQLDKVEVDILCKITRLTTDEVAKVVSETIYNERDTIYSYQEKLQRIESSKAYRLLKKFRLIKN